MTTIDNATSSPPLQPTGSPVSRNNTGGTDATTGNSAASGTTGSGAAGSAAATNTATSSSTVTTLSSISTQLTAAKVAAGDSVFSTDKVNEIKAAIADGRFKVNSDKVANALLDSVHDLLGSRSSKGQS